MAVAKQTSFLANGYELACFLTGVTPEAEAESLDATVLCNNYKSFVPGFKSGMLSAEGLFSADSVNTDDIHDVFSAAFVSGAENVITASLGQIAVGEPAIMVTGPEIKYDIKTPLGQLITVMAEFQASNGINFGLWLMNSQLNAGTNNGTSHDNAAPTTNGGVFHVHLQNATSGGATDVDVKLQHSTDNSAWADVGGGAVNNLSAVHAAGSVTVAPGTTINRYTRVVATVTGGNTVLVSAAFARR